MVDIGKVTVVLPIYNVEKYLNRCVESIVKQTYTNLEIILVDDGSTDNCPQMCDDWEKKDSRIKVVHKKNAGLGMARNTGIDNAIGEYICFFDSDDYVSDDVIEKAYSVAKTEKSEIVTFGFSCVDKDGKVYSNFIPETTKTTFTGDEIQNVFLPDMIGPGKESKNKNLHMSAWASLYSVDMIRKTGWKFVSEREIIAEDVYSLLVLYKSVKRVSVVNESFYYYCDNAVSLTHTYRKDRYEKIRYFHISCVNKARELGYSQIVIDRLNKPYLAFTIAALKMIVTSDSSFNEKFMAVKGIVNDSHLQAVLKTLDCANEGKARLLLWTFMKLKMSSICYLLIKLKT